MKGFGAEYECGRSWPFNGMLAAERSAAHVSDYESGLGWNNGAI